MPSVLITGANRGLGLEFVRQYVANGWEVIASARQSDPELDRLAVRFEPADFSDVAAVDALGSRVDGPLDLFIANAGTNHPMNAATDEDAREWAAMMMVNAIAPYRLAKTLLPHVAGAKGKMIAISSGMASLAGNSGGWLPYRSSKAALNMAWSTLAIEARSVGVAAVLISPGWVKTRMGGAGAEITAQESVSSMRKLIENLTLADSGRFLRRDGSEIPW